MAVTKKDDGTTNEEDRKAEEKQWSKIVTEEEKITQPHFEDLDRRCLRGSPRVGGG
jgi:hypothetical protein